MKGSILLNDRFWKKPVFLISSITVFILVILGATMPVKFGNVANMLYDFTQINFGWLYLLTVFVIIVFLIALSISIYEVIRLGGDDYRLEYLFYTCIVILFSAVFVL